jgi:transposase-like protein
MVVGLLESGGRVITKKIDTTHSWVLQPLVRQHVLNHSTVITDTHFGYKGLNQQYLHETVKHEAGEYARGIYHTNTMEGFWSLVSWGIYGIYHSINSKHTDRYLNEFAQRYST